MARRVREAALFLIGLLAVVAALYALGYPSYHVGERARADAVLSGRSTAALVLGNSHGYCIVLKEMGLSGRNLSRGGQDMFEITYKANVALDRAQGLSWLFIPVSLFHIAYHSAADAANQGKQDLSKRIDMYAGYPSLSPLPGDRSNYVKGLLHPLITQDHWRRVWARADHMFQSASAQGRKGARRASPAKRARKSTARGLRRHAQGRCRRIQAVVRRARELDPTIPARVEAALTDTVAHAHARGVRLVLFTPPYYAAYSRCIPGGWKRQVAAVMDRLVRRHDAEYYDFQRDMEFVNQFALFDNSDHLNAEGARRFSRKFAGALGQR